MLNQEVSVDFWKMIKGMLTYGAVSIAGWVLLRLLNNIITMPRRLRDQQERIQESLAEFQRRYPDLKLTEEELKDVEKELEAEDKRLDDILAQDKETTEDGENKKSK